MPPGTRRLASSDDSLLLSEIRAGSDVEAAPPALDRPALDKTLECRPGDSVLGQIPRANHTMPSGQAKDLAGICCEALGWHGTQSRCSVTFTETL